MRFHAHDHTGGYGHVYQQRFESFPVQSGEHFWSFVGILKETLEEQNWWIELRSVDGFHLALASETGAATESILGLAYGETSELGGAS